MVLKRSYETDPENNVDKGENPFLEFNVADVGTALSLLTTVLSYGSRRINSSMKKV